MFNWKQINIRTTKKRYSCSKRLITYRMQFFSFSIITFNSFTIDIFWGSLGLAIISSGTQIWSQIILDPDHLTEYLFFYHCYVFKNQPIVFLDQHNKQKLVPAPIIRIFMWNVSFACKVLLLCNFIPIALRHGCSPVNLPHIFRTAFSKNTPGWLLQNWILLRLHFQFC